MKKAAATFMTRIPSCPTWKTSLEENKLGFMNSIMKGITNAPADNSYMEGLKDGQKQRQNELERERIRKSINQDKDHDKGKERGR